MRVADVLADDLTALDCLYAGATGAVLAVCEVRLEDFEGIGHVGPTKADADMARLVVDRAWKEQDTGRGELFAVPVEVTDPGDPGEADRACRRADPRKGSGVPLEEAVEERQVAPHDREVAVEEDLAVAQRQRSQELTRRARADDGLNSTTSSIALASPPRD